MLSYTFATVHYLPQDTFNIEKKKIKYHKLLYNFLVTTVMWQSVNSDEKMVGSCVSNKQLLAICHV